MAPALPYVQLASSVMQAQQQNAAGKYNQAIQNRNAQIADQEAQQIEKQKEFDLQRFDQNYSHNYRDKQQLELQKQVQIYLELV
jgi:hypothetical protein